ncbi:MAG: hypothetical protein AB1767_03565 [Bacillota bacterium]
MLADLAPGGLEIRLDVDSTNGAAFNLYRQAGFKIVSAVDYYRRSL